ncbi:MAG: hypothetical protein BHV77_04185 [Bacteroides sp. 43_108]|nr:MAG: hypothetical protein BHV77_04185 [Bacteroides sp. 43_108]
MVYNVRRLILFFLMSFVLVQAYPQNNRWTIYAAYHDASKCVSVGSKIYVLSDGGLYSYDYEDMDVVTYDKSGVLSDNGIFDISYCSEEKTLVIVYNNGNIDLLYDDGSVYNMTDFKNKTAGDKTINDIYVNGKNMYMSTNYGLLIVDIAERIFSKTYTLDYGINSVAVDGNFIYAATDNGVYKGNTADNLQDKSKWSVITKNAIDEFIDFNGKLYSLTSSGVFSIDKSTFAMTNISKFSAKYWSICNDMLLLSDASSLYSVGTDGKMTLLDGKGIRTADYAGNTYWCACGTDGLKGMSLKDGKFTENVSSVIPDSPMRNYSYFLRMTPENRLLVAGGSFNYNGQSFPGTLMKYENQSWTCFDEETPIATVGKSLYVNVTDIAQDPNDSEHHFAGSASDGIFEFKDYKMVNHYDYRNSPLQSILPSSSRPNAYVWITGLEYDKDGNLWMLNNQTDTIVRILKNDGKWATLYYSEIKDIPTLDQVLFDNRGWAWINCRRTTNNPVNYAGVFCVDTKGTLENTADDSRKFITRFSNQDGVAYSPDLFNCIAEDLDGNIWFGTDKGPFVTYSPEDVFDNGFYFTQVKIPRNDGTNLADYLLSDVNITCITIDGGNRKWMGTSGNGVYLLSSDGIEMIEHFTTENSPLISDNIESIAIDGSTGEVFFGTDAGLVSYLGTATDPAGSLSDDNIKVYPNPVRPEYTGRIYITGLMRDTDVKIVSASGYLVNSGTSVGGEYTWDGKNKGGKRVASGVYYVLAADAEGNSGTVAKILVIR